MSPADIFQLAKRLYDAIPDTRIKPDEGVEAETQYATADALHAVLQEACALRQRLISDARHATRPPTSLAHPMVARGEDDAPHRRPGRLRGSLGVALG